ncbi:MAG: hypothetical protein NVSMB9_18810 [Isosphaeraceae bacterium]
MAQFSRPYLVGLLTGAGMGLLVGWVLNSKSWYNGSESGTAIVAAASSVLCGGGLVLLSWGRRGRGDSNRKEESGSST